MLDYLVPSRARREVLRTLCHAGRPLTIRELGRRAGVPYSGAHREVMQLKRFGYLRTERAGKSLLCSWDAGNPGVRQLSALLSAPGGGDSEESLYWNLKRWGAPLVRMAFASAKMSLEATLAVSLALARRDPDVAQVWPVVLAKNRDRVDLDLLEARARHLGQKRVLGYLLSLTGLLLRDPALVAFSRRLRDPRVRRRQDFFLLDRGPRARRLAEENTPRVARDWLYRMNATLENLQAHFDKFLPRGVK